MLVKNFAISYKFKWIVIEIENCLILVGKVYSLNYMFIN